MSSALPVIVFGAGGHAKVVVSTLQALEVSVIGMMDPDRQTHGSHILSVAVLGSEDLVFEHNPNAVTLVNGVGMTNVSSRRKAIYQRFLDAGYAFRSIIHPSAIIGSEIEISDGAQVMAGVIIQPGSRIGANTIINTRASIDHDCVIGAHTHIAPGVVFGGSVTVGEGCHIGAGATVIQNIIIGSNVLVGAGATVISDIPDGSRVAGTPALSL